MAPEARISRRLDKSLTVRLTNQLRSPTAKQRCSRKLGKREPLAQAGQTGINVDKNLLTTNLPPFGRAPTVIFQTAAAWMGERAAWSSRRRCTSSRRGPRTRRRSRCRSRRWAGRVHRAPARRRRRGDAPRLRVRGGRRRVGRLAPGPAAPAGARAHATGGTFVDAAERGDAPAAEADRRERRAARDARSRPPWAWTLAAAALLGVHWIARRRSGLS